MRLVFEQQGEYPSRWAAIYSIANKIGCTPEPLRPWYKRAEGAQAAAAVSQSERERLKELERENRELKRVNEILRKAAVFSTSRSATGRPSGANRK